MRLDIPDRIWRLHVSGRSHAEAAHCLREAITDARAEGSIGDVADLEAALRVLDGDVPRVATTWNKEDGA